MNAAETLRAAAAHIRETAQAATPGPWMHVDFAGSGHPETTFMGCGTVITMGEDVRGGDIAAPNGDLYPRSGYSPKDDMAHIALWNPQVTSIIADWLDAEAQQFESMIHPAARSLARALLPAAPESERVA